MSDTPTNASGPSWNGYTCGCGAFVPYGTIHNCMYGPLYTYLPQWQPPTYYYPVIDVALLERIAKALEEILERLPNKKDEVNP